MEYGCKGDSCSTDSKETRGGVTSGKKCSGGGSGAGSFAGWVGPSLSECFFPPLHAGFCSQFLLMGAERLQQVYLSQKSAITLEEPAYRTLPGGSGLIASGAFS